MPTTPDPGAGIPSGFMFLFVLFGIFAVGMAIYRFSVTKSTAERMGVPPDQATGLALINDPATSTLAAAAAVKQSLDAQNDDDDDEKSLTQRLGELDEALAAGAITRDEYDAARKRLLDNV